MYLKSHQSQNQAVSPENADEITIWGIFFVSPDIALYSTALSMVEERCRKRTILKLSDYICALIPYGLLNSRTITFMLGPHQIFHSRTPMILTSQSTLLVSHASMYAHAILIQREIRAAHRWTHLSRAFDRQSHAQSPRIYAHVWTYS